MDDDQNGGRAAAVVAQPLCSDTCGMTVDRAAAPPAAAALSAAGDPTRTAPPYGAHLNNNNNNPVIKGQQQLKGPGNPEHRTRRPRRGKRKSKKTMPYSKDRMLYRNQAVAPNNTNQFLMDDHNDGPDFEKLSARYNENGRTRNSSFTSVESEGDQLLYSSSDENDGTSLQKEFIDAYRLVQEEQLAELTKNDLTQRVIELEEKVQVLESKRYRKNCKSYFNGIPNEDEEDSIDPEEYRSMQMKIMELTTQNKMLQTEIEHLKKVQTRAKDSDSSIDSESSSDSSDSSSSSSDGQGIEMEFLLQSSGQDDHIPKDD